MAEKRPNCPAQSESLLRIFRGLCALIGLSHPTALPPLRMVVQRLHIHTYKYAMHISLHIHIYIYMWEKGYYLLIIVNPPDLPEIE